MEHRQANKVPLLTYNFTMINPRRLLTLGILLLGAFFKSSLAEPGKPVDFKQMTIHCHEYCHSLYSTTVKRNVVSTVDVLPMHDDNDIKLFACLEGCRMAAIAYPKSELESQKYTFQK